MVNVNDDDTVESKPRAQVAGKNPRAIAKVVTRIVSSPLLAGAVPEEEKSSIPVPAGVSPANKGLVHADSASFAGSLTLGKLVEYEKMGLSFESLGIADALDMIDEGRSGAKFSAEERTALLDASDAEGSTKKGRRINEGTLKGVVSNAEAEELGKARAVQQEPPKSLLNIPKPKYHTDLQFAQELAMADPKIVSSLVKEWVRG